MSLDHACLVAYTLDSDIEVQNVSPTTFIRKTTLVANLSSQPCPATKAVSYVSALHKDKIMPVCTMESGMVKDPQWTDIDPVHASGVFDLD